jgi:metallo-beta-lactamase family protein
LDCYDEEARSYIANGSNPLDFPGLHFTQTADESKALNVSDGSKIIISASGMCDAGRIKHHLKHNLWRKDSSVVFVGYQAGGTLGRRLVDGAKKVRIFGEEITVNARVEMIEGFSGHADRDGLLSWISKFSSKPRKIFLIHGEDEAIDSFAGLIGENLNIDTCIPNYGDAFIVNHEGVFNAAGWKDTRPASVVPYDYKRLQVVAMLDKIKDELEEASAILRDDLKKEKKDIEIEAMMNKLIKFERDLVDLIK